MPSGKPLSFDAQRIIFKTYSYVTKNRSFFPKGIRKCEIVANIVGHSPFTVRKIVALGNVSCGLIPQKELASPLSVEEEARAFCAATIDEMLSKPSTSEVELDPSFSTPRKRQIRCRSEDNRHRAEVIMRSVDSFTKDLIRRIFHEFYFQKKVQLLRIFT